MLCVFAASSPSLDGFIHTNLNWLGHRPVSGGASLPVLLRPSGCCSRTFHSVICSRQFPSIRRNRPYSRPAAVRRSRSRADWHARFVPSGRLGVASLDQPAASGGGPSRPSRPWAGRRKTTLSRYVWLGRSRWRWPPWWRPGVWVSRCSLPAFVIRDQRHGDNGDLRSLRCARSITTTRFHAPARAPVVRGSSRPSRAHLPGAGVSRGQ